jgi:hypothetical protein
MRRMLGTNMARARSAILDALSAAEVHADMTAPALAAGPES